MPLNREDERANVPVGIVFEKVLGISNAEENKTVSIVGVLGRLGVNGKKGQGIAIGDEGAGSPVVSPTAIMPVRVRNCRVCISIA